MPKIDPSPEEPKFNSYYTFRFPNGEVSSSYKDDCFSAIFGLGKGVKTNTEYDKFYKAFIARDAQEVANLFRYYFSKISYHERPKCEATFHICVHVILLALNFKVLTEITGSKNPLDLCVELDNGVCLIIELKYCHEDTLLFEEKINEALPKKALKYIPQLTRNKILSQTIENKLDPGEFERAISNVGLTDPSEMEINQILACQAKDYLTKAEIDLALAVAMKLNLSFEEIKEIEKKAAAKAKKTNEEIDAILTKATQKSLNDITQRGYHNIANHLGTNKIIDLGLAIYGNVANIKAAFGPV